MGDLAVTATEVLKGAGAQTNTGIAGEAIEPGEVVYRKASDQKIYLALNDTAANAAAIGFALNEATAIGQPIEWQHTGTLTIGASASAAAGAVYVVSPVAGKIALVADVLTTTFMTVLGIGDASNGIKIGIVKQPVAHV